MHLAAKIKKLLKSIIPSQVFWIPQYYLLYKRANFKKTELILDAGCGEGIVLDYLAKKGLKVIGFDISLWSSEQASINYKKNRFLLADIRHLSFKANTFDSIFSLCVLECLEDTQGAFKEFRRVLKPEGRLFICVTKEQDCSGKLFSSQRALRKITPRFLRRCGLLQGKAWLDLTSEEMGRKLGQRHNFPLENIKEAAAGLFKILYYEDYIKLFMALSRDFVYGIKSFYYLRFPLFFIGIRLEHYLFKKMPGYYLFLELKR